MSTATRGNLFPKISDGNLDYQKSSQGNTQFLDDGLTIIGLPLNKIDPDLSYNFRINGAWVLARLKSGIERNNIIITLTNFNTLFDTRQITQTDLDDAISTVTGGETYKGTWNANTNTPTLTSSVGTKGFRYTVSVNGATNLNGITDWKAKDWAVYNGTIWEKVDNTDNVDSVNSQTGVVVLTKIDIGLSNVVNTNTSVTTNITDTTVKRFVTDVEKTTWNSKENAITAGTTSQYLRGDKTFQTLDKTAVGLPNVENTSDLNKVISTATQNALDLKADLTALRITEGTTIITNTTLTATTNQQIIKITGNSTTAPIVATLPLASTQFWPIMFYQNIATTTLASYLTAITAQGSDKISNIPAGTNLLLDAGTSIAKVYKLIPVAGGYQILGI